MVERLGASIQGQAEHGDGSLYLGEITKQESAFLLGEDVTDSRGVSFSSRLVNAVRWKFAAGFLALLLILAITISAILGAGRISRKIDTLEQAHKLLPHPRENGSCGGSAEEARKLGCLFDKVEFSWLPPACLGDDVDEYLAISKWKYYDDEGNEVSNTSAWQGENDYLWITWRQHLTHCTFMWKRLHRAALLRRTTDSYIADYDHTTHCAEMLLKEEFDSEDINVQLFVKFPTCGVEMKKDDLGYPWHS